MAKFTSLRRTRLIVFVLLLLLAASLLWSGRPKTTTLHAAPAKGGAPLDLSSITSLALNERAAETLALSDAQIRALLQGKVYDFVYAVRLGRGEADSWQEQGCGERNCAHVTFYNYTDGGTIEAIVDLDNEAVISRWSDLSNRPGPSENILPRALEIASRNAEVVDLLGDIRAADMAMVPMPIWLTDDACSTAWCVDLTYHDPLGSGRIFHVVINMEAGELARTFYSRTRPDRLFKRPEQDLPFEDGCHEQYGWEVCWEMTAHDGLNFSDAVYKGDRVFSSAKIGQVEVLYPAWPGGYRDEVGFRGSVPPHFGTVVNDLEDGFEVRQLYTEFLHWPNCICCYRYEQVLRFFDDGSLEFSFVSHGPGCEDLSNYRPFWRIELDQNDSAGDELWIWHDSQWYLAEEELELELFAQASPMGQRLATIDGDQSYRWLPIPTDPLGLDEAYVFAVVAREGEGDGPIATGPADTFQPPRQWLDGESLDDENIVLWYVPILKTRKGDPYWCMPDPEPAFSPCDSVLRVERGGELTQPTEEEIAEMESAPTPTPRPTVVVTPDATRAPLAVVGDDAETIIAAAGCATCHKIGDFGEAGKVGPDLSYLNLIAGGRVSGMSAEGYIRQSIVDPNIYLAPLCPNGDCLANVMPRDYRERLTDEQIDVVVDYLMSLDYEPPLIEDALPGAQTTGDAETGSSEGQPARASLAEWLGASTFRMVLAAAGLIVAAVALVLLLVALLKRL